MTIVALTLLLAGCASAEVASASPFASDGERPASAVTLPPTSGTFDYQLGGAYDLPGGLDVVARDSTANPEAGAYNICYVNGFQTQPDDSEAWAEEHEDLLLHDADGELVIDPEWPDEYVLDPSTPEQRSGITEIVRPVIEGCAASGFDAVEIDNLDTFTRFDDPRTGLIDEEGALALARSYVDIAHEAGLAIGQKNSAELAERGRSELGFDFAVTEECAVYGECSTYTDAYGDHVLEIEYVGTDIDPDEACSSSERAPLAIIRDPLLTTPADPGYFYRQC